MNSIVVGLELTTLRRNALRYLMVGSWVLTPIIIIAALTLGNEAWVLVSIASLALSCITLLIRCKGMTIDHAQYIVATALMLQTALLLATFSGHPWQIDIHMLFFAALAAVAMTIDWRTILLSTAIVAVHHLVLSFVLPSLVFPGDASIWRVLLHAVILLTEAAGLIWLTHQLDVFSHVAQSAQQKAEADAKSALEASQKAEDAAKAAQEALAQAHRAEEERLAAATHADEERVEAEERRKAMLAEIVGDFQSSINGAVAVVTNCVEALSTSSLILNEQSEDAGKRVLAAKLAAEGAAHHVDAVASAATQLSNSIGELNTQTDLSRNLAKDAADKSTSANSQISQLADQAEKITAIVSLISTIAEQTNLLALNATIEAARAGDAGKGFAVVASEVKNLASASAKAASEIAENTSDAANNTSSTGQEVSQLSQAMEYTRQSTAELLEIIAELRDQADVLNSRTDGFLGKIANA